MRKKVFCLIVLLVLAGCYTASGLKPIYPEVAKSHAGSGFFEVDSLQPTFRWEPFPGSQDLGKDKDALLGRIHNVTYELIIIKFRGTGLPAKTVYNRDKLPEPFHEIEDPLEPSTKYFWSVRAHFEVDGESRVSQWAGISGPGKDKRALRFYRFKTPPE
jgi:hypothetical protein